MKVLLLNGSPKERGSTRAALSLVEQELTRHGVKTEWFHLGSGPIRGCAGCGGCRGTNRCVFTDDPCNQLIEAILAADGLIVGSPVYFAGPSGALCALLDRVFFAACTRGQLFQGKPAAALVSCHWVGGTAALDRLHRYFSPSQMPIVNSSDYAVFPKELLARGDEATLARLKTLGANMARQLLGPSL